MNNFSNADPESTESISVEFNMVNPALGFSADTISLSFNNDIVEPGEEVTVSGLILGVCLNPLGQFSQYFYSLLH